MRKGQYTERQLKRFLRITKFIGKKGRYPIHTELAKMFKVRLGGTTNAIIKQYRKSIENCVLCGKSIYEKV